ncbi:MAG: glutathione transferase [Halobacteriovoraceae bacterium]|jgi:catechol 2,3-dioxygenase-like lactoylglutathione lyase family enzyme|nr:glutathione transferase [Halobacteriovoraceae bacterium]MBT5093824.1 glutathione transferase [Halobacteriovoraceae bacterium]
MNINGINHITFSVSNLERSFKFYQDILGLTPKLKWDKGAYFLTGKLWLCLSLDDKTRVKALEEYSHIAFDVSKENFLDISNHIINSKVEIFKQNESEGDSLYFLDPDGHKLEIHCGTLDDRINSYKKLNETNYEFFD